MPKQDEIRAFVAILLPDEIRASIVDTQRRLESFRTHVCLTKEENLHITLKFLGEISEARALEVAEVMRTVAVRHQPFDIEVCGWGAFPNPARARVVWAGLKQGMDSLSQIARDVEMSLVNAGLATEDRFSAHITLGRVRHPDKTGMLETTLRQDIGSMGRSHVTEMHLMKSNLAQGGSSYSVLGTVKLGTMAENVCFPNIVDDA